MQWPPWEKKIVSANPNERKGLGDFLYQLAEAEQQNPQFAGKNAANLNKVRGSLDQAQGYMPGDFQNCREGNEVLVNCEQGQAVLLDPLAKTTKNNPTQRETLVRSGMVSEHPQSLNASEQQAYRRDINNLRTHYQSKSDENEQTGGFKLK